MLIKRLATDRPDGPDGLLKARRKWMAQALKVSAGTVVLTIAGPQIAFGAGIVAVRVWPAEDYTRVTIESDERLVAVHQMIRNPDRLVVDIDGLDLSPTLRELVAKITPNDPYIQSVRVGQNRPRVVRMVFDLKEDVSPQVFTLAPISDYRNRLVFDLYPVNPPDPLWKLVRDTEDKQRRFAAAPPPVPMVCPARPLARKRRDRRDRAQVRGSGPASVADYRSAARVGRREAQAPPPSPHPRRRRRQRGPICRHRANSRCAAC
jgi:N-acetylmuramoyl-L-alanine amidase